MSLLSIKNLFFAYEAQSLFKGIDFEVHRGQFLGILGPNGCGKTTLLKLLTGVLPLQSGSILLENRELHQYSRRELARKVAVLPQETHLDFPFTALEVVLMGRAPYLGTFQWESPQDLAIAQEAMVKCDCLQFAPRDVRELSGGERERVFLARALAQEPKILLLDEPTTHLDLQHQYRTFQLLKGLHEEKQLTLMVVLHDLNFALKACERVLLLGGGQVVGDGPPEEILTESNINQVYGIQVSKTPSFSFLPS